MRRTLFVSALLSGLLLATTASAETVTEEETSTTFQKVKNFGGQPHILTGTGAREAMGTINVYGAGMYVNQKQAARAWGQYLESRFAKANLVSNGTPNFSKIGHSRQGRHFMVYGRMGRAIEMAFTRDVRADQISEAYNDSWDRVNLDRSAAGTALEQFMAAVNHPVGDGQRMTIRTAGNNIWVNMPSGNTRIQGNRAMIIGIWKIWFGDPALQTRLRNGLMSMLSNVHQIFTASQ